MSKNDEDDKVNDEDMILVWEIEPDPTGRFDSVIIDNAEQAGELITYGAAIDCEETQNADPLKAGKKFTICCRLMSQEEFDELDR